jgi:predicted transcriptional regulator
LAEFLAANNLFEHEQQHKLEIGYFFKEDSERKCICVAGSTKVSQVFHDLVYVDRRTSVPVVDENNKYIGTLHRRDFLFILRGDSFDWVFVILRPV